MYSKQQNITESTTISYTIRCSITNTLKEETKSMVSKSIIERGSNVKGGN